MYQDYFIKEIEARCEKFKQQGLAFLEKDHRNRSSEIFELAFVKFINDSTQDQVQKFIAQISTIKDQFDLLENKGIAICAYVLNLVKDTDRKTKVMQAFYDAGMDPLLKGSDGKSFLYSKTDTKEKLNYGSNQEICELCLPYLKGILSSRNDAKFTEAIEALHLGQLGFQSSNYAMLIRPDFINLGIQAASEYLRANPVVGKEVLKPFYVNLQNPESILGKYCSDIVDLANKNSQELEKLNGILTTGNISIRDNQYFKIIEKNVKAYETIQAGVKIFKEEFQKFPSLVSITENAINGVIKDHKSIVGLPLPEKVHNELIKNYNNTIPPQKREAYNQEQGELDKFAKFTEPQNSLSKGAQAANKTESKHDQSNNKSIVRRKSP